MKEKLEKLRKNTILEVSHSWGLGYPPGTMGTLITDDKKMYVYHMYYRLPKEFQEKNIPQESVVEQKQLNNIEYQKVIKFIEQEILNKNYEYNMIHDVTYHVRGIYNGTSYDVVNNIGANGLQKKADKLIAEIKGEK